MRVEWSQNNPQFSGVMPVRVFIDGTQVTSEQLITKSCRQAIKALTTKSEPNSIETKSMLEYASKDKDYNPHHILYTRQYSPKMMPSDFIRIVHKNSNSYFVTGKDADQIRIVGKAIGKIQSFLIKMGYKDSIDLQMAKRAYHDTIENIIQKRSLRVTEGYDNKTNKRTGRPLIMLLKMKSNGKYGQNNFNIKFDGIQFVSA